MLNRNAARALPKSGSPRSFFRRGQSGWQQVKLVSRLITHQVSKKEKKVEKNNNKKVFLKPFVQVVQNTLAIITLAEIKMENKRNLDIKEIRSWAENDSSLFVISPL